MKLVLASASPRRRELLGHLGVPFEVAASGVDETPADGERPETLARRLAREKAIEVAAQVGVAAVLAADTIVVHRGAVLNKPNDPDEAREMLGRLRDRRHRVITAVALTTPDGKARVRHEVTRVVMRPYAANEVEASIERGDPFDKAGGYAIQDPVFAPVAAYDGCYCNVVGLPLWTVLELLRIAGLDGSEASMPAVCRSCPARRVTKA